MCYAVEIMGRTEEGWCTAVCDRFGAERISGVEHIFRTQGLFCGLAAAYPGEADRLQTALRSLTRTQRPRVCVSRRRTTVRSERKKAFAAARSRVSLSRTYTQMAVAADGPTEETPSAIQLD